MTMRELLVMLKNWSDIAGVAAGMALAVYGLLNMGILAMVLIGMASAISGYGIGMTLKAMDRKSKKNGDTGV